MPLPKIEYPIHNITIPSLKKKYKFRPFLVKEEKILLMAKESKSPQDILVAIKQVINNCCLDNLDLDNIALFDLEYLFLKLRAISVDNIVNISYRDKEDNKIYDFEVDLNEIEIKVPDDINFKVESNETSGLILKFPPAKLYDDKEFLALEKDHLFELIVRLVDKIYINDEVFESSELEYQEISEHLDSLDLDTFDKIKEFLERVPRLEKELKYKNSLGKNKRIVLRSLNDFFTFR